MEVYLRKIQGLRRDLEKILELMSWEEVIGKGDTVLIKPNFCTHELRNGVTTNLSLLNELVNLLDERAGKVLIGETHSWGKSFDVLKEKLELDCEFVNLSEVETKSFDSPFGPMHLPKLVFDSKLVNVPVLKTHSLTSLTLGIKNLFGLLQTNKKQVYHRNIDKVLLHLLGIVNPALNILDATYSMEGSGPTSGTIIKTDFLLASRDVVSLDAATCELMGMRPKEVPHIAFATDKYGTKAEIVGDIDLQLNFDVPKIGITEKLGAYLQSGAAAKIIMHPKIYPRAKSVRDFLKKL